ncbi:hypothetical protein [Scytonema sp. NUACC26]|uniref:hypothetical protein n=1 Tax=Scytonema sp. NUACC26 TaxID=3140176 RepID=UPI0034DBCBB2
MTNDDTLSIIELLLQESHETMKTGYYHIESINKWHLDHQIDAEAAYQYWETRKE